MFTGFPRQSLRWTAGAPTAGPIASAVGPARSMRGECPPLTPCYASRQTTYADTEAKLVLRFSTPTIQPTGVWPPVGA